MQYDPKTTMETLPNLRIPLTGRYSALRLLAVMAGIALVALLVFRDLVLSDDVVLFMTDNNLGFTAGLKEGLPRSFLSGAWAGGPLIGMPFSMPICIRTVLLWGMSLLGYTNWFHAITMSVASLGLALFCMRKGCHILATLVGVMTAFWVGSNLTLTYSGHDGKYGVLALTGIALWLIEMSTSRKWIPWSILAGGAVGMMFVEQQDVALFIGLFLGAYAVFAHLMEKAGKWYSLWPKFIIMALFAAVIGGPSILAGYMTSVKGVVAVSDENPQRKWEYCTQWSLTPEDTFEFIAPGYRGIRTGDPEGPYWGRQGRSAEWEHARQGFSNFKLESVYVGMIPIAFAMCAIVLGFVGFKKKPNEKNTLKCDILGDEALCGNYVWRRADVIFWGGVTLVALMLAWGKYFPLYGIFYQIPGMSSIRNPNKFLHVFQIGLGILAAFGVDVLIKGLPDVLKKRGRVLSVIFIATGIVFLVWAAIMAGAKVSLISEFEHQGWSTAAPVIVRRMMGAVLHAATLSLVVGVGLLIVVLWCHRHRLWRECIIAVLVVVMMADIGLLSRDYIKVIKINETIGDNAVTVFLKNNLNQQRAYMLNQEGFYNNWLMVLFPYHRIETFNVSQMPRMPQEYSDWLKVVGRDPIRLWQLSAIGYVLAPDQAWQQIRKDSRFSQYFDVQKGFNVFATGDGIKVVDVPGDKPAGHHILKFKNGLSRFDLYYDWDITSEKAISEKLIEDSFVPVSKVWVSRETFDNLPEKITLPSRLPVLLNSSLTATDARANVDVSRPAIMMFVNKHSPDWRVSVDGKSMPLLRCNSICMGVYLEPGKHEVRFYLRNQWGMFLVEVVGLLMCFGAVIWLLITSMRRKA